MSNVIYRGPIEREPLTVNLPVDGALLPGSFVKESATSEFEQATAGTGRLFLLSNRRFVEQGPADAYADGETGVAFRLRPDDEFQARMAAATYAKGAALTVAASGRLAAAGTGDVVVAFFDQAGGAVLAGVLADVVIANSYVSA